MNYSEELAAVLRTMKLQTLLPSLEGKAMNHKYQGWAIARNGDRWMAVRPHFDSLYAPSYTALIYLINTRIINARIDAAERR